VFQTAVFGTLSFVTAAGVVGIALIDFERLQVIP
jgi:hypothetical protein